MAPSRILCSELYIAKEDGRTTVRLFVASPTPLEEKNFGRLFAVIEIDSQDSLNDSIIEMITQEVSSQYYRSESFELEVAFERALQKTNLKLQEITSQIGEEWLGSLNMIIGVEKERQLVLTHLGRVIGLMISHGKTIDVIDVPKTTVEPINPVKVFSQIITGEIPEQSILLFGTETILDYLSKEKIKRILTGTIPEEAVEQLHALLEEDTTNTNFAAIIFKAESTGTSRSQLPQLQSQLEGGLLSSLPHDSMTELLGKQHHTEELLSASIWPRMKKSLRKFVEESTQKAEPSQSLDATEEERTRRTSVHIREKTAAQKIWRALRLGAAFLGRLLIKILQRSVLLLKTLSRRWRRGGYQSLRTQRRGTFHGRATGGVGRALRWFADLTRVQKAFFIIAVIVLAIFAQSVINRGEEKLSKDEEKQFSEMLAAVDLKINEGKAAALYDTEEARTLLLDAKKQLESIPEESKAYTERGQELSEIIARQLKLVNNVITVENPTPLLDYTSITPTIQLSHMILLGASIYAFDQNHSSVYRGNTENGEETVTTSDTEGGTFTSVAKASPGTGVVVKREQSFALFNPVEESLEPLVLSDGQASRRVVDIRVFGTRLYTLDVENNQIFRFVKVEEEFEAGTPWIADARVDLKEAISFAIDGDIYVLNSNGNLTRLATGTQQADFHLVEIDPRLTSAEKVYTDENTTALYLLDATNKRVVAFTKEGKLLAQYTSPTFTNLKDMIVDEPNGKLYLLNDAQVYVIDLQQQAAETQAKERETQLSVVRLRTDEYKATSM